MGKSFLLAVFLFLLTAVSPTLAQQPVTDDQVNEVAKGLYCPVCESTPLDVCPTQACIDWRNQIRGFLADGQTEAEIHTYFAQRFGDGVLAEPPRSGINLILWLFPAFAIISGGIFFGRYLRSLKLQPPTKVAEDSNPRSWNTEERGLESSATRPLSGEKTPSPAYIARIEAELANE